MTAKSGPKSGGQKWTLKVAAKSGSQKWTPKVVVKSGPKSGGQTWTSKVAVKIGPQKWRPKVTTTFFFFLNKSRNLSKIVSVLLSASVERFFVSRMRDFSSMFDAFVRILLLLFLTILFHIRIALGLLFLKHILIMLLNYILLPQI